MHTPRTLRVLALILSLLPSSLPAAPRVLRDDLALELFAREPAIATPVAIAVDGRGRVWAIESNTHFPLPGYARHATDRILILADTDGDGAADDIRVFRDGLEQTMGLALRPGGQVYLATRRDVMLLVDANGDDRPESSVFLARLETREQYPHNGLSGFAFDGSGHVFFAIGENMGVDYKLTAADGSSVTGGPEGGSIFRMTADGKALERWAVGFWNTFHMAFDREGELFAVDNDPDSRPPCRLLHIARGGDYGYRRWLGRKGLHPFTAWNGELPGTLPMVSGTGEAPSGVLPYEPGDTAKLGDSAQPGLPADLRGELLVTSWGDYRVEAHALEPRGASFRSVPVPLVQGGEDFRPVGIAMAPDGSVYFSDWVDPSYNVHAKGRIWRLRSKPGAAPRQPGARARRSASDVGTLARLIDLAHGGASGEAAAADVALELLGASLDPFLECAAVSALASAAGQPALQSLSQSPEPRRRLLALIAMRRAADPWAREALPRLLRDPDLDVRRAAVQWVGEEKLAAYRKNLDEALASGTPSRAIFEAYIAAVGLLRGEAPDGRDMQTGDDFLAGLALDGAKPATIRALALRSLPPAHPRLDEKVLHSLLGERDEPLRLEAARSLAASPLEAVEGALLALARDPDAGTPIRCEAVIGLSRFLPRQESALRALAMDASTLVRHEAERALRLAAAQPILGREIAPDARAAVLEDGDAAAGERLFFHPRGPRCSTCHAVRGRGGVTGPDLSAAGHRPRAKLLESILEPSREVAPQFVTAVLVTREGPRTGTILGEDPDGTVRLATAEGAVERVPHAAILARETSPVSIMPEGLIRILTVDELRNLLAFLEAQR